MHIGMNLPVMAPGLDRDTFLAWCRAVDQGPFHTLAAGERVVLSGVDRVFPGAPLLPAQAAPAP